MKKVIYLAACGDFKDYKLLESFCNFFTKNISKDDLEFITALGGKNGDKLCRLYVLKNNIKHIFLKPSQMDKKDVLENCSNAILFNNGHSKGIAISLNLLAKYVKGKIVEVHQNINEFTVYKLGEEPFSKRYSLDNDFSIF